MLKKTLILISVSIFIAFAANAISPVGIPLVGQWDISEGIVTAKAKSDFSSAVSEISDVETAKAIFDAGIAVFVDARTRDLYKDGHIPGAVSLPVGQFDETIQTFIEQYPSENMIVAYCSGKACEDSHALATRLLEQGYSDVSVFIDGFSGWESEGHPVE
ncbi:MAG: hypothetical protein JRD47_06490 [Deltaproteobacteria bacterium]|nr:hypothetical protein [Deltaproteobacteria bacterium]MBW2266343.1 hypothetical protein [Deltaproteobacteria bacterium]MBW2318555.1 hypothetical protein [Deltaproteobacteria bacterium]MBW2601558.1 hypothetical protein [Deltaproteobacteria bacterium]